jgi:glycosidase
MEFHISRRARDYYRFEESLFRLSGNVIFANLYAVRQFVQKMNQKRDLVNYPEQAVKPGQINAMGLIDEILHYVVALYRKSVDQIVMTEALSALGDAVGEEKVRRVLLHFVDEFPPLAVYRHEMAVGEYLDGSTEGVSNSLIALEELLLLWLANMNPAFSPFSELFNDSTLKRDTAYLEVISALRKFFERKPFFGPHNQPLIDMLRSPAIAVPYSLPGQLDYIREHWGALLGTYFYRLLTGRDFIREEEKITFLGPGPAEVYRFAGLELEAEHFSPDREWMPRLVLMAKNIYVWLDQLSKKYGRQIAKLHEVPDNELDLLRDYGFSGLWLIGIWERSPASQRIKQLCGNPEAVPSAYSLFDYQIAADLGGEESYEDLKRRARDRRIRLASDMVPNHVGIYSKWVVEHPDWFVSLDYNPFPWYSFNGPDLSSDERVGVFIEDHYYDRTDASVIFKRVDRWTGSEKFVYHGNDGTSMPWNDTAQLDYLNPEVREAMIRTILHVAHEFPIIRFDAAMTLTKKHYQRLWFPEPGSGGAIPTRAEHGLTKADFNKAMPNEFWREVVDRIAQEAPDTLLLAEAFWLLEGYFVRTLGMHRVYNSAFMNMLRDEENAKYRMVMKNTLEFDPEVLRRFVNFMNNPDERTAVDQFGKDKKYFGVCVMMVTLPGLPMFGHGQVEGYSEKYGMEYRRAYWDEQPDRHLVGRHEREIFPLLHHRNLFAGVSHFLLYDFFNNDGTVNEDVFAYSNGDGQERAVVSYNNRNASAAGWIKTSVAFSVKGGGSGSRVLEQRRLGEGIGLTGNNDGYVIFRDHMSNLEYIRNSSECFEKGLYLELGPYDYHVFLDFRELQDNEWRHYAHLTAYLNGRGVPSVENALRDIFLQPVHQAFNELVNIGTVREFLTIQEHVAHGRMARPPEEFTRGFEYRTGVFLREIKQYMNGGGNETSAAAETRRALDAAFGLPRLMERFHGRGPAFCAEELNLLMSRLSSDPVHLPALFGWLAVRGLGQMAGHEVDADEVSRSWIDEWSLGRIIQDLLHELGFDDYAAWRAVTFIKVFTSNQRWYQRWGSGTALAILEALLKDYDLQQVLQINRHRGTLWFNKEAFEEFLVWMVMVAVIKMDVDGAGREEELVQGTATACSLVRQLRAASDQSQYQVEKLLTLLENIDQGTRETR